MPRGKQPTVPTATLAAEYEAGASLRQLAARHGVSFQSLAMQLKTAGVPRRPKHPRKREPRPCATCGTIYTPRNAAQRYCCRTCVPMTMKGIHYKTHCKHGHPLVGANLDPRSGRTPPRCRDCRLEAQARYRARKKAR